MAKAKVEVKHFESNNVTAHPRLKTGFLPRITWIFTDPSPVKIRVIREIRG